MSTPKNHHYVSQCQIRSFFNNTDKKIYLYDKQLDNLFNKTTTKTLFSESELNSALIDGQINHSAVEDDLRLYLEDCYTKNMTTIVNYISTPSDDEDGFIDALMSMFRLGVIGEIRHPKHKKDSDDMIFKSFEMLAKHADNKLKEEFEELFENRKKTKYTNTYRYAQISGELLQKMGEMNFTTCYIVDDSNYFILPDCSATTTRARINDYFNPDLEDIAAIFMPISSKIFIIATADKFDNRPGSIKYYTKQDSLAVEMLNHMSLVYARKIIACEDEGYLRRFIDRQKVFCKRRNIDIRKAYKM